MYYIDYDPFVLPFTLGVLALLVILLSKFFYWWDTLQPEDRIVIRGGLRSWRTFSILHEVFMESLIHRKMWKQKPLMGYMHMTFAFGWFMLILIGNFEARIYSGIEFNMPYYPIFFKFFLADKDVVPYSRVFTFVMDFFLLFVISGLLLAMFKRVRAKHFGMKRPTRPEPIDRLALASLWFIFPLRLLAESFTSAVTNTGGFLTATFGNFLDGFLPAYLLAYPAWWAYSLALGVFFVCLPFSRYMHIPAEVLLIYLRKLGFAPSKEYDFFSKVEVNSCPSCGLCIEVCQLKTGLDHEKVAPAYFLRDTKRNRTIDMAVEECLLCGRCQQVCPVGIHVNDIRVQRRDLHYGLAAFDYSYLVPASTAKAELVYFAGCMTHLTPGIKKAMKQLLSAAGVEYLFIDKEGGMCCGRPMQMSGQWQSARELISKNQSLIAQTGARVLLTSCPICLKVFREEYTLNMEVLHHSQYLRRLLAQGRITLSPAAATAAYHDPCELGRGCQIFTEPRELISHVVGLQQLKHQEQDSHCCGGSLGSFSLNQQQRNVLSRAALDQLLENQPDMLITSCPLCKKTFQPLARVPVLDLAELLAGRLVPDPYKAHPVELENRILST